MKITFDVKNQILSRTDRQYVIANSTDYLEAEVTFTDDWNDLEKNMQFVNGDNVVTMTLTEDDGKWVITQNQHLNLGIGTWKVSIIGVGGDTRIITNAANLSIRASGYIGVAGPISSIYEQLLVIIQSLHTEAASSAVIRSAVQQYITDNFDALVKEAVVVGDVQEAIDDMVEDGTFSALLDQVVAGDVPDAVEAWLEDHVDPDTGYVIDNTLTTALAAADAKATGDAIGELNNALTKSEASINGGYFTVNDGISGYYDADGEYTSNVNYKCANTKVMNISSVSYEVLQAMGGGLWPVLFVDADDEVISRGGRSVGEFTVAVPSNCAKILMNFSNGYVESYNLNSISVKPDKTLEIEGRPADAKTVGDLLAVFDIEKVPDEVQTGTTNTSYYLGNDEKVKASTDEKYKVIVYAVTMGTAYKLYATHARIRSDVPMAGFSTSAFATGASFTTLVMGSNTETDYNVDFVAPANGYIFVAQYDTRTTLSVATAKNACTDLMELDEKIITPISGKKFLSIGDSLTNLPGGGIGSGKRWQSKIVSMLDMDSFITSGAIGLTVIKTGDNSIWQAVQNLTYDSTVGLISFWGGTNDFIYDAELGDFDEQANSATRDETTFYGAAFDCFEKLLTLYPTIPIFAIGTTQRIFNYENYLDSNGRVNNAGLHVYDYGDALKKVAEYYSIPFVDLYRTSGINKYTLPTYMFAQTSDDHTYYLHLSNDGEDKVGNRLCAFLKATLN